MTWMEERIDPASSAPCQVIASDELQAHRWHEQELEVPTVYPKLRKLGRKSYHEGTDAATISLE